MMRVTSFEQLEYITSRLFVEAVCPKCGTVMISTMPDAQMVLVFGCRNCADIDKSTLLSFNNLQTVNITIEEAAGTLTN